MKSEVDELSQERIVTEFRHWHVTNHPLFWNGQTIRSILGQNVPVVEFRKGLNVARTKRAGRNVT
jgi:hypothetical protein